MDFKESLIKLSEKIQREKDVITTEEGTKNAFIMPILTALGYDVFDPYEVVPEMDCDLTNRGDKIDYAININGKPSILIECKHWKQNLNVHETQLKKYFVASNARFAILTNGIDYNFYTDTEKVNIMDDKPFFMVNMLKLNDITIRHLEKFCKSNYNGENITHTASFLKTKSQINEIVARELKNPSSEFVRYFVKEINGMSNKKLIELYTPLIKESIDSILKNGNDEQTEVITHNEPKDFDNHHVSDEKQKAFEIVREILNKSLGSVSISCIDYKTYFVIRYNDSEWYWVCRLTIKPNSKRICFPYENYKSNKWYDLGDIENIPNFSSELVESYKMASKE